MIKVVKEIKKDYIYDITYLSYTKEIIWQSISICYEITPIGCYYRDVSVSDLKYESMLWNDNHDILDTKHYIVKELGNKKTHPEYFL